MQISEPFSCQIGKILKFVTSSADRHGEMAPCGNANCCGLRSSLLMIPIKTKNIPTLSSSDFPLVFISFLINLNKSTLFWNKNARMSLYLHITLQVYLFIVRNAYDSVFSIMDFREICSSQSKKQKARSSADQCCCILHICMCVYVQF